MHLQQLKGLQSSRPGLFCKKLHENGMELDLGAEPPPVERFLVLTPGGKLTKFVKTLKRRLSMRAAFSNIPLISVYPPSIFPSCRQC